MIGLYDSFIIHLIVLENKTWNVVEELNECNQVGTDDIDVTKVAAIDECAIKCEGLTQMFAYGTNDFGADGCKDGLCKCHCLNSLNKDTCQKIKYDEYWVFTYKDQQYGNSLSNVYYSLRVT